MVRKFGLPFAKGYSVRLQRVGCGNRPFYLIGAVRKSQIKKNDIASRPDEIIGSVDPMPNDRGEIIVGCDLNRLNYYLGKGARPSRLLAQMLGLGGAYPLHPKLFINAWRHREGKITQHGLRPSVHPTPKGEQPAA